MSVKAMVNGFVSSLGAAEFRRPVQQEEDQAGDEHDEQDAANHRANHDDGGGDGCGLDGGGCVRDGRTGEGDLGEGLDGGVGGSRCGAHGASEGVYINLPGSDIGLAGVHAGHFLGATRAFVEWAHGEALLNNERRDQVDVGEEGCAGEGARHTLNDRVDKLLGDVMPHHSGAAGAGGYGGEVGAGLGQGAEVEVGGIALGGVGAGRAPSGEVRGDQNPPELHLGEGRHNVGVGRQEGAERQRDACSGVGVQKHPDSGTCVINVGDAPVDGELKAKHEHNGVGGQGSKPAGNRILGQGRRSGDGLSDAHLATKGGCGAAQGVREVGCVGDGGAAEEAEGQRVGGGVGCHGVDVLLLGASDADGVGLEGRGAVGDDGYVVDCRDAQGGGVGAGLAQCAAVLYSVLC